MAQRSSIRRRCLCSILISWPLLAAGQPPAPEGEALAAGAPELQTVIVSASAMGGPGIADSGSLDYAVTAQDIQNLPEGQASGLTDVLSQMPGVAIDQNQQLHIRNTEGPQFQYQINGLLVPLDINTNPPFLSMLNPLFVRQLDLLDGVLPARYSYATGGVVDIRTKDGCDAAVGQVSVTGGQRSILEPQAQYGGCSAGLSSYVSAHYQQGDDAFSSATPGPDPLHDRTHQGQLFGYFAYPIDSTTRLSLLLSGASSRNQLPNVPGLAPEYLLAGPAAVPPSAAINSYLDFSDALAMLALNGSMADGLSWQLAGSEHAISQQFKPDDVGELIYQGVASRASHVDHDSTLEGDLSDTIGAHGLSAGFYAGEYRVSVADSSLVFPVDLAGAQSSSQPIRVDDFDRANNLLLGIYVSDLWQLSSRWRANLGLRWDHLSGFSDGRQFDPTLSLSFAPSTATTWHAGLARNFQVPSFLGISPTAQAAFAGTTAAGPAGVPTPRTEDDYELDAGVAHRLGPALSVSADGYYQRTHHYLDTGQFGVVPIFAPFNYGHGYIWGAELAARYQAPSLTLYANLTLGRNLQRQVATGQFNFPADELQYINTHPIVLDHQPLAGVSAGLVWHCRAWSTSLDAIYSSGLRAGFADLEPLPAVLQFNLGLERSITLPGHHRLSNRITVLNLLDRVNLIRPSEGIGIFQSAYGPRFTLLDTLSLNF